MCKTSASVILFLETGRATASINHGLTEAFEWRWLGLLTSKNQKHLPPKRFFFSRVTPVTQNLTSRIVCLAGKFGWYQSEQPLSNKCSHSSQKELDV
jgi:hypothetical protein